MSSFGRSTQTNTVRSLGQSTQTMNQLFDLTYHGSIDGFEAPKILNIQSRLLVRALMIRR